jgi:hypothetical protein
MDPTDPGPSEGCYADNSLDPLHTRTLETADVLHKSDALDGHGPTSGISIDALDGHGSFLEIEPREKTIHKQNPDSWLISYDL